MRRSKSFFRWLTGWLLLCMLGAGLLGEAGLSVRAAPQAQAATNVVISEFRTRGQGIGGTGVASDEFIELYNPTGSNINITGWKVRKSSGCGATLTDVVTIGSVTLLSGQYYLIGKTPEYSGSVLVDQSYTTTIADDGGIALVDQTSVIVDQVGMCNTTTYKEGTFLSPMSGTTDQSYERKLGGSDGNCIDLNDNSKDFIKHDGSAGNTSNPQNFSSPTTACGIPPAPLIEVIINEVAWAGTQAFPGDEWIELYNPGSTDVVLDGWRLEAAGGIPSIVIPDPPGDVYVIPAFGFFLLERGDDNVVSNVTAGYIYSSGLLPDSGETLYLRKPDRSIVDTANLNGGGWPAGSSTTTATMQRGSAVTDSDFAWVTYSSSTGSDRDAANNPILGTPGRENQPTNVTATATFAPPTQTPTSTSTSTPTITTTPLPGNVRSIVINEVAWAGTRASADDEWIELYNPGTAAINLAGWVLKSSDGSPTIELPNVNLAAGAYFLLERTDDNTVADITADLIYTGSLTNSGEILYLYDPGDRIIDTANSNGGLWPAGNPNDYSSMQRSVISADSDFVWVTYDVTKDLPANYAHDAAGNPIRGTPRRGNLPINVTATPTRVSTTTGGGSSGGSTGGIATPAPVIGISEFLPRPGHDWNNDGRVDVFDEFIEIINAGRGDINLSAYRLDDEQIGGSIPYVLPNRVLKPDERAVFYASETGILLSDAGDTVRLLRGNTVIDAYTYTVVRYPDQSWCRIPDRLGYWNDPCFPTPGNPNALTGKIPLPSGPVPGYRPRVCLLPDTTPDEFIYAECEVGGDGIWNRQYWDGGDVSELLILSEGQKWVTIFE